VIHLLHQIELYQIEHYEIEHCDIEQSAFAILNADDELEQEDPA
jgi:hypothetical protein